MEEVKRFSCPKCRRDLGFEQVLPSAVVLCPDCNAWIDAYEESEHSVVCELPRRRRVVRKI